MNHHWIFDNQREITLTGRTEASVPVGQDRDGKVPLASLEINYHSVSLESTIQCYYFSMNHDRSVERQTYAVRSRKNVFFLSEELTFTLLKSIWNT